MIKKQNSQSVEPKIADLVNTWLKKYKLDYKLEQENLNPKIDNALKNYASKSGGDGATVWMQNCYYKMTIHDISPY